MLSAHLHSGRLVGSLPVPTAREADHIPGIEGYFCLVESLTFCSSCLPANKIWYVIQLVLLVQLVQIRLHYSGSHQVYPRQQQR